MTSFISFPVLLGASCILSKLAYLLNQSTNAALQNHVIVTIINSVSTKKKEKCKGCSSHAFLRHVFAPNTNFSAPSNQYTSHPHRLAEHRVCLAPHPLLQNFGEHFSDQSPPPPLHCTACRLLSTTADVWSHTIKWAPAVSGQTA